MQITVQYNKDTGRVKSYSKGVQGIDSDVLKNKTLSVSSIQYSDLTSNYYDVYYKRGKLVFAENNLTKNRIVNNRKRELESKLLDKTITEQEKDELILILVQK